MCIDQISQISLDFANPGDFWCLIHVNIDTLIYYSPLKHYLVRIVTFVIYSAIVKARSISHFTLLLMVLINMSIYFINFAMVIALI